MKKTAAQSRQTSMKVYVLVLIIVALSASVVTIMLIKKSSSPLSKAKMNESQEQNIEQLSGQIKSYYTNKYQ